jgi:chromate transporter
MNTNFVYIGCGPVLYRKRTADVRSRYIAIILAAVWPLAKKAIRTIELGIIGIAAFILTLWGVNEVYAVFAAGGLTL